MRRLTNKRLAVTVLGLALLVPACPFGGTKTASDVEKVENKLVQVANGLNALAKTNRQLYQKNVINLAERRLTAGIINRTNTALTRIEDRVFQIDIADPGSIAAGKVDVVTLLREASTILNEVDVGTPEMRAAAQLVIALINEAIDLTQRIKTIRSQTELRNWQGPIRLNLPEVNHGY